MIDFVLNGHREKPLRKQGLREAIDILVLKCDLFRTLHLGIVFRNRQAPFGKKNRPFAFYDLRVKDDLRLSILDNPPRNDFGIRRRGGAFFKLFVIVLRIEHDHPLENSYLVGGEPNAGRFVHGLEHIVGQFKQRFFDPRERLS